MVCAGRRLKREIAEAEGKIKAGKAGKVDKVDKVREPWRPSGELLVHVCICMQLVLSSSVDGPDGWTDGWSIQ